MNSSSVGYLRKRCSPGLDKRERTMSVQMSTHLHLDPVTTSPTSGLCNCRLNTYIQSSWEVQTSVLNLHVNSLSHSSPTVSRGIT